MDISFNCSKCGQSMVIDGVAAGSTIDCPNCGQPSYVPSKSAAIPTLPPQPSLPPMPPQPPPQIPPPVRVAARTVVVLTDIQIPFWRTVWLMITWGIASIPAAIVLMTLFFFLWTIFAFMGLGLMMHGFRP